MFKHKNFLIFSLLHIYTHMLKREGTREGESAKSGSWGRPGVCGWAQTIKELGAGADGGTPLLQRQKEEERKMQRVLTCK